MGNLNPPPIQEQLVEQDGGLSLPWVLFFTNLFQGDTGTEFTPTFENLTQVGGSATITGRYYLISRQLCYFSITVTPVTNTSATAGATAVNNFPLNFSNNGIVFAVSGLTGTGSGMVNQADNKIYVPAWSAVTVPVTIVGIAEVL